MLQTCWMKSRRTDRLSLHSRPCLTHISTETMKISCVCSEHLKLSTTWLSTTQGGTFTEAAATFTVSTCFHVSLLFTTTEEEQLVHLQPLCQINAVKHTHCLVKSCCGAVSLINDWVWRRFSDWQEQTWKFLFSSLYQLFVTLNSFSFWNKFVWATVKEPPEDTCDHRHYG